MGDVENLEDGLYHYNPKTHTITKKKHGDLRNELANAALRQDMLRKAPISFIVTAIYERTTGRYRERGIRYVHIEVGHVGQNIYLQAEPSGLAQWSSVPFMMIGSRIHSVLQKNPFILYLWVSSVRCLSCWISIIPRSILSNGVKSDAKFMGDWCQFCVRFGIK